MDETYEFEEPSIVDDVEVYPLSFKADRKRAFTVIVNDDGEAWLLPSEDVPGDFRFRLTVTEVSQLPKPYDFTLEIEELLPTVEDIKRAFWQRGIVTLDDLKNVAEVRNALGVLPSANAFVQFTGDK